MNKILEYCFGRWWRPLVFFGLTALLFVTSEVVQNHELIDYAFYFLLLGYLMLIFSTVYQLRQRKWLYVVLNISILGLGIVGWVALSVIQFWIGQFVSDRYADNLIIPDDIEINDPIESKWNAKNDSVSVVKKQEFDFEVYQGFQPGLYKFDVWIGRIDSGIVYLKAYEITQNDRLSKESLTKGSSIRVGNINNKIKRFKTQGHFTIYEGDFGQPYAARFEVWYLPDKGGERKLAEKNYKIEGWQR
jgi:hypothetical protein